MKLPIIINEHDDISFYRSLKNPSSAVEAVDVKTTSTLHMMAKECLLKCG